MTLKFYFALLSAFLLSPVICHSQEAAPQMLTKLDKFTSKSGLIIKFEDYALTDIMQQFDVSAESRIRKVYSGDDVRLFYQITNDTKYGSKTASIALEDFIELNKALSSLKNQLSTDLKSEADYLENKFVTEDGFHLGYLIQKGKPTWYLRLERYGTGSSVFLKSIETLEESFRAASSKMDKLK